MHVWGMQPCGCRDVHACGGYLHVNVGGARDENACVGHAAMWAEGRPCGWRDVHACVGHAAMWV